MLNSFCLLILKLFDIIIKTVREKNMAKQTIGPKVTPYSEVEKEEIQLDAIKILPAKLTHSTLGTVKRSDGWYVVEVRYNPETQESGDLKYTKAGLERASAIELFKKMSVNLNLVG